MHVLILALICLRTTATNPTEDAETHLAKSFSTREVPNDKAFLRIADTVLGDYKARENTKVETNEGESLSQKIDDEWKLWDAENRKPGIRFVESYLANKLANAVSSTGDDSLKQYRAKGFLLSLPIETLKFSWLLHAKKDYEIKAQGCTLTPPKWTTSVFNHLTELVQYMYVVASNCDKDNIWKHPSESEIRGTTINEFMPNGTYTGGKSPDGDVDPTKDKPDDTGKIQPKGDVAATAADAASDISSILTNESNMVEKLSAVSITMSGLGRTSVQAAAQVQILNTYIDLVQRAMIQLVEIDKQMGLVTAAQSAVFANIEEMTQPIVPSVERK